MYFYLLSIFYLRLKTLEKQVTFVFVRCQKKETPNFKKKESLNMLPADTTFSPVRGNQQNEKSILIEILLLYLSIYIF